MKNGDRKIRADGESDELRFWRGLLNVFLIYLALAVGYFIYVVVK